MSPSLGSGAGLFPLPRVAAPLHPRSRSRRVMQRYHLASTTTALANSSVSALNYLNVSFSSSYSPQFRSASEQLYYSHFTPKCFKPETSPQSRLLAHIYSCASRYSRRLPSGMCDEPSFGHELLSSDISYSVTSNAIPIIASRVSLPSSVGTADLMKLLPPDVASVYSSPSSMLRPPDEVKRAPRVMLCASPAEYLLLVRRMADLGMVEFTTSPKVVNGVFGVPKDGDSIRLIIDARPANAVFVEPPKVNLPTPDLLSQLVAPEGKPFFVAKVDIDNFYHRLALPNWMRPYFALPALSSSALGLSGPERPVYPCCTTLPMGWSHSVYIAQIAHEHLLDTRTRLSASDRITSTNDFNIDRPRHQVYIDDLNLFGPDADALAQLQSEYISAVASCGLPVKPSKVIAPSCDGVECIGLEVHGITHEVGVTIPKLEGLCRATQNLVSRGSCTGIEMSQLIGKWTWAALVCRSALSVFNAVYRFIECAGRRVFDVWPSCVRELDTMVRLSPLFFATLENKWFGRVICTDASESGQGVVAARATSAQLRAWTKFGDPGDRNSYQAIHSTKWSTIVASPWQRLEHINTLEVRAVSTAVRWSLSFPNTIGRRVVILSDSMVTVCSVMKGRSSSPLLLPRLRQLASMVLASGLRLHLRWIPTEVNPADRPSRLYES